MAANFKGYFLKFKRRLSLSYLGYLFIYIPLKGKLPSIAPRLLSLAGEAGSMKVLVLFLLCLSLHAAWTGLLSFKKSHHLEQTLGFSPHWAGGLMASMVQLDNKGAETVMQIGT